MFGLSVSAAGFLPFKVATIKFTFWSNIRNYIVDTARKIADFWLEYFIHIGRMLLQKLNLCQWEIFLDYPPLTKPCFFPPYF